MNVPTIEITKSQALQKLESYREQLRRRADGEYEAAVKGYEALAAGKILIDLVEVFRDVPTDDKDRPMLAIARADRRQVQFEWSQRNQFRFDARSQYSAGRPGPTLVVSVDAGRQCKVQTWLSRGYALIPMVPADVRPNVDLKKCHVLWEVPVWADNRIRTTPPTDPYLVQHLAGSLYVVLAEWELTELERAITRGRAE